MELSIRWKDEYLRVEGVQIYMHKHIHYTERYRMEIVEGLFVWLMIIYASISINGLCCWGCMEEERNALLQIKESINSPQGSALSGWYEKDCCQWEGVECSPSTSTVIKLFLNHRRDRGLSWYPNATMFAQLKDLQELQLQGNQIVEFSSPTALGKLKHLQTLNLQRNAMQKGSRLCWGEMLSLRILDLSSNELSGWIPRCLCEMMHSLTKLDLSDNQFHGEIDACFSNMSSLEYLDISGNLISGNFPAVVVSNLTNIEAFMASHNQFSGEISFSVFANLSRLSYLDLSYNDHLEVETESPTWVPSFNLNGLFLRGCNLNKHSGNKIPSFISTQYHLLSLALSYNSLVGNVPSQLLYNVTSVLRMRGNNLSGSFPQPMENNMSSKLTVLDISDNLLHGPIPSYLHILFPKLYQLNVSWNSFEGGLPLFTEMRLLRTLDLSSNRLVGEIPFSMSGNTTNSLEYLKLSDNSLQGKILPRNSSFPKLKWLQLGGNNFTELNSHSLSTCTSLQVLYVAENSLSGELSTQLPLLTTLKVISLRRNHLGGSIPMQLCQMEGLSILDIAENNFSDTIPFCLNNITYWTGDSYYNNMDYLPGAQLSFVFKGTVLLFGRTLAYLTLLDVSSNQLTGTIPFQMGDLRNMGSLNVSNNLLTGSIPMSLGSLTSVESLDLSHNKLSGSIPTSLGSLKWVECLDLSHNKLFGQIPGGFGNLAFLSVFSIAFNNLSGPIPRAGLFRNETYAIYMGNPHLCGSPLVKPCSSNVTAPPPLSATAHTNRERHVLPRLVVLTTYILIMFVLPII